MFAVRAALQKLPPVSAAADFDTSSFFLSFKLPVVSLPKELAQSSLREEENVIKIWGNIYPVSDTVSLGWYFYPC